MDLCSFQKQNKTLAEASESEVNKKRIKLLHNLQSLFH
jgi:hypothetical protein